MESLYFRQDKINESVQMIKRVNYDQVGQFP